MDRIRPIGLLLVAVLAVSAVTVASASAAEPFFANAKGEEAKEGTGEPQAKSGESVLKTLGEEIICIAGESTNVKVLNGKSTSFHLLFKGCRNAKKQACTTEKEPSESILTTQLLATLYYKNREKHEVGTYVEEESTKGTHTGELAKFKCGEVTSEVTGCVVVEVTPVNKLVEPGGTFLGTILSGSFKATEPNGTEFTCEMKAFGLKGALTGLKKGTSTLSLLIHA